MSAARQDYKIWQYMTAAGVGAMVFFMGLMAGVGSGILQVGYVHPIFFIVPVLIGNFMFFGFIYLAMSRYERIKKQGRIRHECR